MKKYCLLKWTVDATNTIILAECFGLMSLDEAIKILSVSIPIPLNPLRSGGCVDVVNNHGVVTACYVVVVGGTVDKA